MKASSQLHRRPPAPSPICSLSDARTRLTFLDVREFGEASYHRWPAWWTREEISRERGQRCRSGGQEARASSRYVKIVEWSDLKITVPSGAASTPTPVIHALRNVTRD